MQLQTEIKKVKKKLIKKAHNNGIYENFGQKEILQLENKYIDSSNYSPEMNNSRLLLQNFSDWCMEFDGNIENQDGRRRWETWETISKNIKKNKRNS
jgi:hypothetical protein